VYTRCPQCGTTFRLTAAQLKARNGQVRCGRCQHVFQADQHLVERPPKTAKSTTRKRAPRKPPVTAPVPEPRAAIPETAVAAPEQEARATVPEPEPLRPARVAKTSPYWLAGSIVLVVVLLAQGVVFYGQLLGRELPLLQPAIDGVCRALPCRRLAPIDMRRLDLTETRVTPHPRYDRALRIRATIVNRAEHAQPYPLLEVSLIDNQGHLVARRAYPPRDYLKKPETIAAGLPPHVAVQVSLDITSPGPKASGYEVLLLPPGE
jgi:predicted Zn finger-like uncharacterized protein